MVKVPVLRRRLPGSTLGQSDKGPRLGRRIQVAPRARGLAALSTLVHEAVHQIDHRLSERTVLQLEQAIVYLILENPALFRQILRRVS